LLEKKIKRDYLMPNNMRFGIFELRKNAGSGHLGWFNKSGYCKCCQRYYKKQVKFEKYEKS
tara:strand:- start:2776 stop:2958 length:183 start_codon:yes stop_codon:yes gene_type:complete